MAKVAPNPCGGQPSNSRGLAKATAQLNNDAGVVSEPYMRQKANPALSEISKCSRVACAVSFLNGSKLTGGQNGSANFDDRSSLEKKSMVTAQAIESVQEKQQRLQGANDHEDSGISNSVECLCGLSGNQCICRSSSYSFWERGLDACGPAVAPSDDGSSLVGSSSNIGKRKREDREENLRRNCSKVVAV